MIDAHHHLWTYSAAEYPWIPEGSPLHGDHDAAELAALAKPLGVDGSVVVQARQSVEESRDLIARGEASDFIRAIVGWAPLSDDGVDDVLAELATEHKFRGVRHVCQSEPDGFMLDEAFTAGVQKCATHGLTYDLLIVGRQLAESIQLVDRCPDVTIVLDHIAKPTITAGNYDTDWDRDIRRLAERENVWCKVSGMATEVTDGTWTTDLLRPYWDAVVEAFGPERLMFGSDWPVCLLATEYGRWVETTRELASELSESERAAFFDGNARRAYGIEDA